jgi:zinc D-Ala-D-Ala carboxypeptidase
VANVIAENEAIWIKTQKVIPILNDKKLNNTNNMASIPNQVFTRNFSLSEFLVSDTAARRGITEQNNPPQDVVDSLRALTLTILQPLRDALGYPISVTSGYRCLRLNTEIKGAKNSQHIYGQAADIIDHTNGNEYLFKKIIELKLPFDQLINEFNYQWVHVSYKAQPRGTVLAASKNARNKTVYSVQELA